MHASHESAHVENSVRHDVDWELDTQLIVCEQTYSLFADLRNKSDHQLPRADSGVCAGGRGSPLRWSRRSRG